MVEIDHGFTTEMKYGLASGFSNKYPLELLRFLKSDWYNVKEVYPISRKCDSVQGISTYKSVKDLPEPIDVLIVVNRKDITFEILKEVLTLPYKPAIWFMPGSASPENIALCEDNKLIYAQSCLYGHREFKGISKFVNMHYIHSKLSGMHRIPRQSSEVSSDEELLVKH